MVYVPHARYICFHCCVYNVFDWSYLVFVQNVQKMSIQQKEIKNRIVELEKSILLSIAIKLILSLLTCFVFRMQIRYHVILYFVHESPFTTALLYTKYVLNMRLPVFCTTYVLNMRLSVFCLMYVLNMRLPVFCLTYVLNMRLPVFCLTYVLNMRLSVFCFPSYTTIKLYLCPLQQVH